jgi:hypothetical protein
MNPPPVPPAPARQKALGLEAVGALGLAMFLPALWSPLILASFGLIVAAFVMAIMTIVKGKPAAGALLIAACPFAAFMAFAMMGVREEVRKQRATERQETEESAPPAEKWVRLKTDTQLSAEGKQIPLAAGQRLKVLGTSGRYYTVEYERGRYMIPIAITKAE